MKFLKRIKWGIAKRIRLMICPYDKLFSDTKNSCHFIGIGGIGMSALAFIMKAQGFDIRGSDMKETAITEKLRKGIPAIFNKGMETEAFGRLLPAKTKINLADGKIISKESISGNVASDLEVGDKAVVGFNDLIVVAPDEDSYSVNINFKNMFDDQTNNPAGGPPKNLPMEPEDMFAGIDNKPATPNALNAGALKPRTATPVPAPVMPPIADTAPVQPSAPVPVRPAITPVSSTPASVPAPDSGVMPAAPVYAMKEPILGKVILVVVLGSMLGGLGFGGWWVYNYMQSGGQPPLLEDADILEEEPSVTLPAAEDDLDTKNQNDVPAQMNKRSRRENLPHSPAPQLPGAPNRFHLSSETLQRDHLGI